MGLVVHSTWSELLCVCVPPVVLPTPCVSVLSTLTLPPHSSPFFLWLTWFTLLSLSLLTFLKCAGPSSLCCFPSVWKAFLQHWSALLLLVILRSCPQVHSSCLHQNTNPDSEVFPILYSSFLPFYHAAFFKIYHLSS